MHICLFQRAENKRPLFKMVAPNLRHTSIIAIASGDTKYLSMILLLFAMLANKIERNVCNLEGDYSIIPPNLDSLI